MCGIVGMITKATNGFGYDESEIFTQMLQMDSIRGDDSTGAFGVDDTGRVDIIKGDTDGWTFTQCKNYNEFHNRIYSNYKIVIGHNRSATRGTVSPHNAHPFKEDKIVLVHNGTIHNQEELAKDTEVDSHAIAKALSKADAKAALNQIHGAFALVWFDGEGKTLNLARNTERPLFLLETNNLWLVSSEPGLPYWLVGRTGKKFINPPKLVPVERILQFRLDALTSGFTEVEFENYVYVPPKAYHPPDTGTPVIVVPDYTRRSHMKLVSNEHVLKQGDEIIFNIDDVKFEEGDTFYTVFGHPVFKNNELDKNIIVKTEVKTHAEMEALRATGYASGTVSATASQGNIPVVFVRWCTPMKIVVDRNQNMTTDEEIKKAIADGCNRCKGPMSFVDIADSIIRKKKDGSYRTLCKKCLTESIKNVPVTEKVLAH